MRSSLITVTVQNGKIAAVDLPEDFYPQAGSAAATPSCFRRWYASWYSGGPVPVDPDWFDWSTVTPFASQVLSTLLHIPFGRVSTYADLAALAGRPTAVRAVASVMACNPFPLIYPCHRIICSDRTPGSYSRVQDSPVKRRLLLLENRDCLQNGRVDVRYMFRDKT